MATNENKGRPTGAAIAPPPPGSVAPPVTRPPLDPASVPVPPVPSTPPGDQRPALTAATGHLKESSDRSGPNAIVVDDTPTTADEIREPALPEHPDEDAVRAAREKAGPRGNVFRVTGQLTTPHKGIVASTDFPDGTDFERLVKLGVLEPIGELKPHPEAARALGAKGIENVDKWHEQMAEMREAFEDMGAEIVKLRQRVAELEKLVQE